MSKPRSYAIGKNASLTVVSRWGFEFLPRYKSLWIGPIVIYWGAYTF